MVFLYPSTILFNLVIGLRFIAVQIRMHASRSTCTVDSHFLLFQMQSTLMLPTFLSGLYSGRLINLPNQPATRRMTTLQSFDLKQKGLKTQRYFTESNHNPNKHCERQSIENSFIYNSSFVLKNCA